MPVKIEKKHLEICDKIVRALNQKSRKFSTKKNPAELEKYEKDLFARNITLEEKKKKLLSNLFRLIISTFAVDLAKIKSKTSIYVKIKTHLTILRNTVGKLRDINYYLKTIYITEIKISEKTGKSSVKSNAKNSFRIIGIPEFAEEGHLDKQYLDNLEHTVYLMISKSAFLDQKLLEEYKTKKIFAIEQTKTEIKDLEDIIARQSELLCHLEAKLPPEDKFRATLLNKRIFTEWVARIFALLAAIHLEAQKEEIIFRELRKSEKIRKILNQRINSLIKEKFALMKIKEDRLLSYSDVKGIEKEHHIVLHHYTSSLKL